MYDLDEILKKNEDGPFGLRAAMGSGKKQRKTQENVRQVDTFLRGKEYSTDRIQKKDYQHSWMLWQALRTVYN